MMGIFDDKKSKDKLQFLDEERKKIWDRLVKIEGENGILRNSIEARANDSEKDAAHSSRKAAEFRNKTESRLSEASEKVIAIETKLTEASNLLNGLMLKNDKATELTTLMEKTATDYQSGYVELDNKVTTLSTFLEDYPTLDTKLEEIDEFVTAVEESVNKSKLSLNSLNTRKKEIDEFHRDIFGYVGVDDNDAEIVVAGKKEEIENAFGDLGERLSTAEDTLESINSEFSEKFVQFEKTHKTKYESVTAEIASLLPNALTAGLSAAFSDKKTTEETNSKELQDRFAKGIYILIGVSLIPFIVSVYFLNSGVPLQEVINRMPRLVLAIIPMYIPVLWFTYSANKKLNLSKRLIEEYAHKEVLSKTYEGLSKQISNLESDEQTEELKYRLLSSILQVTSENPGKLISNYEASDHPVMEALEQSYKFQIAIDKLESIPGLGKVAAMIESNAKKRLQVKEDKIENALNSVDNEEAM